jgi:hypothetical protein
MLQRCSLQQLRLWFEGPNPPGIGIITGEISGDLRCLDFDDREFYFEWKRLVRKTLPSVWERLVIVKTPTGGRHVFFRCGGLIHMERGGRSFVHTSETVSAKSHTVNIAYRRVPHQKDSLGIEFYQHGHFLVAPGSPAGCHKLRKRYTFVTDHDFDQLSLLKISVARQLVELAASLDQRGEKIEPADSLVKTAHRKRTYGWSNSVADRFNAQAKWDEILVPHGWEFVETSGEVHLWRRPGTDNHHSATINYAGNDLLHVFSQNAEPFEADRSYTKFLAYTLLNHQGDFRAAFRDLECQTRIANRNALYNRQLIAKAKSLQRWRPF